MTMITATATSPDRLVLDADFQRDHRALGELHTIEGESQEDWLLRLAQALATFRFREGLLRIDVYRHGPLWGAEHSYHLDAVGRLQVRPYRQSDDRTRRLLECCSGHGY